MIGISFLINISLLVVYSYINAGQLPPLAYYPQFLFLEGWPIVLQSIVLIYFVYLSILFFNERHSKSPNHFRRFAEEIAFIFLAGFGLLDIFRLLFEAFVVVPESDPDFLQRKLRQIQLVEFTQLAVVYGFMTAFRIFGYLQQKQLELLNMQRELAQSQFEALKNQLNPHFLFNSLSVLSSLVYVDGGLAETFVEKLSKTYRYILEQKDKVVVPLVQEYTFLDHYLFLLEQRFTGKLEVHWQRPSNANQQYLPPHSLMIAFEHIINTNAMSTRQPLQIHVEQTNQAVMITYSRHPRPAMHAGTEEQWQKLKEAFDFAVRQPIIVEEQGNRALIQLPLTANTA